MEFKQIHHSSQVMVTYIGLGKWYWHPQNILYPKNLHWDEFITIIFSCIKKVVQWQGESFIANCCDWQIFYYCIWIFLCKCFHITVLYTSICWNWKSVNYYIYDMITDRQLHYCQYILITKSKTNLVSGH